MTDLSSCPLTDLVLEARAGRAADEAALAECSLFVYRKLQRDLRLDEDVRQDFFIAFLPYLKKFINRFQYKGIPIERCLVMIMKKRLYSFFRSQKREGFLWRLSQDPSIAPAYGPDGPPSSPLYARLAELLPAGPDGRLASPTARKRYLVWMLKHCRRLSAADFALTARLTGCDESWLRERADELVAQRLPGDRRLKKLTERRNRLFVQARVLEMRIRRELGGDERRALRRELDRKRRSLRNAVHCISRIAWDPSNPMVARALGLPKGTVDTIISRIQGMLETRAKEVEAASA